jgi:hypothetical protein
LKKLPFFSGGLLRCNFAPAWSLNRLSPEVSHVCFACEYLCYVILVFVTFLDVLSLQIIYPAKLSYASFPCLLSCFSSVFFLRRISLPPSRLRFGVLFFPLVELASVFYPDILCCSCVIDFMSRMCNDILSCESVLSAHSGPYPCL